MATTTISPILPTPMVPAADNHFLLHDSENKTLITYNLQKGGPLTPGSNAVGPEMMYAGAEGTITVSGPQVAVLTTPVGTMVTVVLNIVPDLRTLKLSLLLPTVVHQIAGSPQAFQTIAILAAEHTSLTGVVGPGGNPTYTVLKLHGEASHVLFPD